MAGFFNKTIFFPPKDKRLAKKITIKTPLGFKQSIKKLQTGGLTTSEFRALNLAKTRAKVQLLKQHLSPLERLQFSAIARTKLPKPNRR